MNIHSRLYCKEVWCLFQSLVSRTFYHPLGNWQVHWCICEAYHSQKQHRRVELGEGKYQNTLYKTLQESIQSFKNISCGLEIMVQCSVLLGDFLEKA